ncbi:dihydroorotase [Flavobacteriaceae bacterium]|nr:dihydroorotase [Flavobacteriaceae bacterium]
MKILLQKATLIDSNHAFHYSTKDILITDGIITAIEDEIIDETAKIISYPNLHISRGWFDSSVCFGEPGYEERETLENGLKTAGLSGFTQIAVNPNTNPITDNQSTVCYLKNAGNKTATQIHPIASFSKNQDGKLLTELYDLKQNGAVAFGDYKKAIKNAELLKIALQYVQRFDGLLISHPTDTSIGSQGGVHEGDVSTRNGLLGTPTLSEILQIQRDLAVLEYSGGKLHIPFLSSAAAVELIRKAKKQGLQISCSVALANLVFTEEEVSDFNTHFKLDPPLRTDADRTALIQGVIDGTIDMVTSNHEPLNVELKHLEFEYAATGTIGLEAMFGVLCTLFPLEKVIAILTKGKTRFGIENQAIEVGQQANLSLFNPSGNGTLKEEEILSSSKNCAFLNSPSQGTVYGAINNKQTTLK